ncbi:putative Dol-P-Glc:Glc(2)Man(9)GlcNAc(2)-PP-Dol alpha-1,2-glucosyltransferase [Glarea lozoyensis 74030]|uniref:Dol-P-Glc:Glc(2)Man(9)GlcNAc(2)-PP-Dol alpha-1,2-glucosyltransferase n=1 Tax=Glarea lozoyensis (strain ATCC 74030 / MF5533) TaxID=1104152 RepID=H0EER4_GLAL7|nr:putative Dol-P-Glc:Glc(2)Man(9)GlcNAc(2)-PP-Dol alpha-1,2-glucosyltransferase [Glarea lozoyensis 74030]
MAAITPEAVHTAVNIALFPPLFFFSGLFYTDVLSTRFVLEVYRMFLIRKGVDKNSGEGLVMNYVIGIFALTMRQTNIFWVAIYLGGLEAVRAIKMNVVPEGNTEKSSGAEPDPLMTEIRKWGRGSIHDVALEDANLIGQDFALMPISLAVAVLHQPKLILARLWPYIALLVSFLAFVYINGGVVLGKPALQLITQQN